MYFCNAVMVTCSYRITLPGQKNNPTSHLSWFHQELHHIMLEIKHLRIQIQLEMSTTRQIKLKYLYLWIQWLFTASADQPFPNSSALIQNFGEHRLGYDLWSFSLFLVRTQTNKNPSHNAALSWKPRRQKGKTVNLNVLARQENVFTKG